ncbi:unnamed protein product [Hymenolepis diminuta]|uniref:Uncharacterized protein n=1 Tax=Hymenolepis diminuta TaxID=6216 RepID=A0A564Y7J2_HYMDI|nr:unnamed protein product [Hymenolepis diminuta]
MRTYFCLILKHNGKFDTPFYIRNSGFEFEGNGVYLCQFRRNEFTEIKLPLTGWRATDEAVYPTADGAMIVTTHYRLIIQWPEAIPIVNRAMQHPYLLFENSANGGTEIIVYFDDPVFLYLPTLADSIPLQMPPTLSNIYIPILREIYRPTSSFGRWRTYDTH